MMRRSIAENFFVTKSASRVNCLAGTFYILMTFYELILVFDTIVGTLAA